MRSGWLGRGGRTPFIMANFTSEFDILMNGSRGLKTYVGGEEEMSGQSVHGKNPRRASTTIIAKEKTSASLLSTPDPFKTSGAV